MPSVPRCAGSVRIGFRRCAMGDECPARLPSCGGQVTQCRAEWVDPLSAATRLHAASPGEVISRAASTVRRPLMAWLADTRIRNKADRSRLDAVLGPAAPQRGGRPRERLNNQGRGTRVEINLVDQSRVEDRRQRDLSSRNISVRGVWDRAVDAWIDDDVDELDAIWGDIIQDLGSEWDADSNVSSIGWPPETSGGAGRCTCLDQAPAPGPHRTCAPPLLTPPTTDPSSPVTPRRPTPTTPGRASASPASWHCHEQQQGGKSCRTRRPEAPFGAKKKATEGLRAGRGAAD